MPSNQRLSIVSGAWARNGWSGVFWYLRELLNEENRKFSLKIKSRITLKKIQLAYKLLWRMTGITQIYWYLQLRYEINHAGYAVITLFSAWLVWREHKYWSVRTIHMRILKLIRNASTSSSRQGEEEVRICLEVIHFRIYSEIVQM